jgi:N-acetylglucosamine malate deacetylase 1
MNNRVLVIAPHPDDEVLGVGGTMAKFASEGAEVYVAIVTKGYPPDFTEETVQKDRAEALAAHQVLGVKETIFLSFPAARLDSVPHCEVNSQLIDLLQKLHPDIIFIPFNGDIHLDHQRVFLSALVAARPNSSYAPKVIYAYETLSETNWNAPYLTPNFVPNVFVDISPYLETKMKAMQMYASQLKPFPHERSEESLRALATLRGSTVGCFSAEAFYLVRQIFMIDQL